MTLMRWLSVVGLVLVIGVVVSVRGDDAPAKANTPNPQVDKLAHEGYWLKDEEQAYKPAMAMLGKPAPALKLTDWHGSAVTGDAPKGKIVLIDFWATWCGPCIGQIPHANAISKKYADKGVVVFGACCPQGSDVMAKTADDNKMEYPTGKLSDDDTKSWRIAFWPTYAVIDRDGQLRAIGLEPEYVEKVLDALLEEQPAPAKQGRVFSDHQGATSVVYLCDATGAMINKMATLKDEINKSIVALKPEQSLDIVFFQDVKVEPFQKDLIPATAENKRKAGTYLEGVTATGTTDPIPAMIVALKLKPDVVYFITDAADFPDPPALLDSIKKYADPKTKINTILFVENKSERKANADSEGLMTQIANKTGGKFRWVDMDEIP